MLAASVHRQRRPENCNSKKLQWCRWSLMCVCVCGGGGGGGATHSDNQRPHPEVFRSSGGGWWWGFVNHGGGNPASSLV